MRYLRKALPPEKQFSLFIVVAILLVSYFFSMKGLSHHIIRRDELTTLGHIGALEFDSQQMSIDDTIVSLVTYSQQHPPLYFVIANVWGRIFSYHYVIVEFLSVIFGILTLASLFRLATDIGGRIVGYYSLFIVSTSILFLFYTYDLRQYTLTLLLSAMSWLLYRRATHSHQGRKYLRLALLTMVMVGAVYTHYSTVFILFPIGLYHLLHIQKTKLWWQVTGAFTFATLLFLPWLPIAIDGFRGHISKIEDGRKVYMHAEVLIETGSRFFGNGSSLLFILLIVLFGASVWVNRRGSRNLLFYGVSVTITILVMNHSFHLATYIRYILVYLIPFSFCAGMGLSFLHGRRIVWLMPIVICISWIGVGTHFMTDDEFYKQTQTIVPQFFIEFQELNPLIQDINPSDTILVPVVRHYGLTRRSKQKKKSIFEYYLSWMDMPYTNIYSGRLTKNKFVLEDVWQGVQGYSSIWLTYPKGDLYEIRKFKKRIKHTHTLCQSIEYGERSHLEVFVINQEFDELCSL